MTKLLGILNVTPDSFSDGGLYLSPEKALAHAAQLFTDGATWVDIGAESTRPGAEPLTPAAEWNRLEPVLEQLIKTYPGAISLDTRHASTAAQFCALGGTIINDVSGAQDPNMRAVAAQFGATIIVNHFPGKTVQEVHEQQIDSLNQVHDELHQRARELETDGVDWTRIILDPGIGFGKTMDLNRKLLGFGQHKNEYEALIGHSKKRFLGEDRKEKKPNAQAAQFAIDSGADWLRVHDPAWYADLLTGAKTAV